MSPRAILDAVSPVLDRAGPGAVVVAFSGGGDSTALLSLTLDWARARGREVIAATVDHGLRPASAAEAARCASFCVERGVAHVTLRWDDWDGRGNLQDAARGARRRLIGGFARARGAAAVLLGHTRDDQAETFLLRLARGSGVDGLAAMAVETRWDRLPVLRPMLAVRRAALRDYLRAAGLDWIEDPSNDDPRFARSRVRAALDALGDLGLGTERLAETAAAMRRARAALDHATADLARAALVAGEAGDATIALDATRDAPREIRLRLLAGTLAWVSGDRYRPRLSSLERMLGAIEAGEERGLTLHGCVIRARRGQVAIRREPARVAPPIPLGPGQRWDGRWQWAGADHRPGTVIGALGEAGLDGRDWRARGLSRETLLSTPALWRDGALVAAPLLRAETSGRFNRVSPIAAPWEFTLLR